MLSHLGNASVFAQISSCVILLSSGVSTAVAGIGILNELRKRFETRT